MTSQINPPDRQEVQQILLALSHSLQNVSCDPGVPLFAYSPAFGSQFSISVTYSLLPIADRLPYSNPFPSPSVLRLKLRVKFYFVLHLVGEQCFVMIENGWSAMTHSGRSHILKGIVAVFGCVVLLYF